MQQSISSEKYHPGPQAHSLLLCSVDIATHIHKFWTIKQLPPFPPTHTSTNVFRFHCSFPSPLYYLGNFTKAVQELNTLVSYQETSFKHTVHCFGTWNCH